MSHLLYSFFNFLLKLISQPQKVTYICLALMLTSLIFNGTLYKIWDLNNEYNKINERKITVQKELKILEKNIQQALDPEYIEQLAKDRYEMAGEGDLIFVFSE